MYIFAAISLPDSDTMSKSFQWKQQTDKSIHEMFYLKCKVYLLINTQF
ncbi:hypothetical protein QG37_02764 [Candidozyma auris]|uniref:Uncharacterized protein n=1 Tax=Candidozyma auris TaxID=498019 RepID=A0A0L0P1U0_CANAR|nr:hypothetical protein QG37_02764 [[Candida] auris]